MTKYCIVEILCTATDIGIYGLLASQSCYHSMLAPCWFTLWTSKRFLNPYILLISLEIFLFYFHIRDKQLNSQCVMTQDKYCCVCAELQYVTKITYILVFYARLCAGNMCLANITRYYYTSCANKWRFGM